MRQRIEDLAGKRFGRLVAIQKTEPPMGKENIAWWICKCDCGNTCIVRAKSLKSGDTQSCGCLFRERQSMRPHVKNTVDLTGKRFGRLVVLKKQTEGEHGTRNRWICKCDCGNVIDVAQTSLISGRQNSCGCLQKEYSKNNCSENVGIIENTSVSQIMDTGSISKSNTSGVRGVSRTKHGKYVAYIGFKKKLYYLGSFVSIDEAAEARQRAEAEFYGDFLEWYSKEYPEKWEKMKRQKTGEYQNDQEIEYRHRKDKE